MPRELVHSFFTAIASIMDQLDSWFALSKPRSAPTGEIVSLVTDGVVHVNLAGTMKQMTLDDAKAKGLAKYAYSPGYYPSQSSLRDIGNWSLVILSGIAGGGFAILLRRNSARDYDEG